MSVKYGDYLGDLKRVAENSGNEQLKEEVEKIMTCNCGGNLKRFIPVELTFHKGERKEDHVQSLSAIAYICNKCGKITFYNNNIGMYFWKG